MKLRQIVTTAADIGERWAGIPGIERTPGGRLFVVWFSGGPKEPAPENAVYMTVSDDGGASFAPAWQPALPRDGARAFDPTLWLAPDGVLWLIFNRGNPRSDINDVHARLCRTPDAPDPQWSEEFRVGYAGAHSFRMNKPTVLTTGEWLMPVTHAPRTERKWDFGGAHLHGVGISTDGGQSWTLHGAVEAPPWALENMIVERTDGSLVMYIRCGAGVIWQSVSQDRGRSWSPGEPTRIPNPGSRFHVRRLADGDWLLLNSPDPKKRTGIVACLSHDEGETWGDPLALDERDHVSYPDAALAPDGTLYAVHDRDRGGAGEILLSTFHKSDIPFPGR